MYEGEKPKQSRKSPKKDEIGRAQYFVTIFTVRLRYAVDELDNHLLINLIEPPDWS